MKELLDNWTVQARKGLVELAILTSLAEKECYAYELSKQLSDLPGLDVSEGTIYPLLSRLKNQGMVESSLVESQEGPVRKYYCLTNKGKKTLVLMEEYLKSILKGIETLRKEKEVKNE